MKSAILLITVFFLLGSLAVAYGSSPLKATGGVRFMRMGDDSLEVLSFAEFEAHDAHGGSPDKGSINFHDADGNKFKADVTCVTVCGDYATFSGPVTKTNVDDWEGMWIQVWVYDAGSSGTEGDLIGGEFFDADPGCNLHPGPDEWLPVIGGNLTVHGDGICREVSVWLDDILVQPGDTVLMPVHIEDVTGLDVLAFEMGICWCELPAGLLEYLSCVPGEVMINAGWPSPFCGMSDPNCVHAAGAGPVPLTGGGVLFYIQFHVSDHAKPCMCCDLEFTTVIFYDPEEPIPSYWENGSVCIEWCDVAGCMTHWKCCQDSSGEYQRIFPLAGVQVHLVGTVSGYLGATWTGPDGCYEFRCFPPLDFEAYDVLVDDYLPMPECINAYDASMVLRYVIGEDDLDDCAFRYMLNDLYPQIIAADVNCTGEVTAYDAALIMEYCVGGISMFPCPNWWSFLPLGENGNRVYQCPGLVNWVGVLRGDVDGCFACAPDTTIGDTVWVFVDEATDLVDMVEVPITVQDADDIYSAQYSLVYDPADLVFVEARPGSLSDYSLGAYNDSDGSAMLAMAAAEPYGGDGEVAVITFLKQYPEADASSVMLTGAFFNNGNPPAVIGDSHLGASSGVPAQADRTALGRAAPNPFAEGTVISYQMAAQGPVSIKIYNVEGKLVRTLVDGKVDAGTHSVIWNGIDNSGKVAARGVYFCCMQARGYRATEKIVFVE